MFISYWNKSVILTYLSALFSILGITLLFYSNIDFKYSMCCLMTAGVLDMFDGTIARMCKRTEKEKYFGVQLDSLVDVVSFVVFPVILLKFICNYDIATYIVSVFYCICGIARLGFFNTMADLDGPVKYYLGLPVTFSAFLLPFIYMFNKLIGSIFPLVYIIIMFVIGLLFILNIKIPKPKGKAYIIFSLVFLIMTVIYLVVL